jgi:hypothetical protein
MWVLLVSWQHGFFTDNSINITSRKLVAKVGKHPALKCNLRFKIYWDIKSIKLLYKQPAKV